MCIRDSSYTTDQKSFVGRVNMLNQANITQHSRLVMAVAQEFESTLALVIDSVWVITLCIQMCNLLCDEMVHVQ